MAMVKDYLIEKYGERQVFQGGLRVPNHSGFESAAGRPTRLMWKVLKIGIRIFKAALVAVDTSNGHIRA
jgi:hypothetical protein